MSRGIVNESILRDKAIEQPEMAFHATTEKTLGHTNWLLMKTARIPFKRYIRVLVELGPVVF